MQEALKKKMQVSIRKFEFSDIPNKVRWINNPQVNQYLNYDLPLEIEKTEKWFLANQNREDRYDAVIEVNGLPVGLIGLLSIDTEKKNAEYYISLGEPEYFGKGIATLASIKILQYAFNELHLDTVYLYTECANKPAIRLYERVGFRLMCFKNDSQISNGESAGKFYFEMHRTDYENISKTPIVFLDECEGNQLYIKRDDLLPFSFGGNKARKAAYFFREVDSGKHDCVVTYGSSSSNHCRVIANMAASRDVTCYIIGPDESSKPTFNSKLMELMGAHITVVPVDRVHDTIENKLQELRQQGHNPYFIAGGGHGNLGTQAYVDCYREIKEYEVKNHIFFDYIFVASGTGTTQAGLVSGQLLSSDERRIVGISIARKNPRGRQVVIDSINEYLSDVGIAISDEEIEKNTIFDDSYVGSGYGQANSTVQNNIMNVFSKSGIPMDSTYTGKAYTGMVDYLQQHDIRDENVLFIHTGGTPLFFDDIMSLERDK